MGPGHCMTACVYSGVLSLVRSLCFDATWRLHTSYEHRAVKTNAGNTSMVLWLRFIPINRINSYLWSCANCTCTGGGRLRSSAGSHSVVLYSSYESLSRKTHLLSLDWIFQSQRLPLQGLWGGSPWQHRRQKIKLKSQSVCEMFWFVHAALTPLIRPQKFSSLSPHTLILRCLQACDGSQFISTLLFAPKKFLGSIFLPHYVLHKGCSNSAISHHASGYIS